jgi:hypothetical protein
MSGAWLPASLRAAVEERAGGRCEYCRVPDGAVMWPHEADHIIAEQHGGKTDLENLALACFHCNRHKGPNVASVDPQTGQVVRLFNPRAHRWAEHFRTEGPRIEPLSDIGRVTVELLRLNAPARLLVRQALRQAGRW